MRFNKYIPFRKVLIEKYSEPSWFTNNGPKSISIKIWKDIFGRPHRNNGLPAKIWIYPTRVEMEWHKDGKFIINCSGHYSTKKGQQTRGNIYPPDIEKNISQEF